MDKSRVKLTICGSDYVVLSDDSESYIRSVGDKVDEKMNDILSKNPKLSISMAAVLSALEFCDETNKASEKTEDFRNQIKNYVDEISKYREKNEKAEIEISKLKNRIDASLTEIEDYKNQVDSLLARIEEYKNQIDELSFEKEKVSKWDSCENEQIITSSLLEDEFADDI